MGGNTEVGNTGVGNNRLTIILVLVVAGITLYPLLFVGFTTRDDSEYYLTYIQAQDHWRIAIDYLYKVGTRPLHNLLMSVPYLLDDRVYFKAMQILSIGLAVLATTLVAREFCRHCYLLFPLLYFAFLQNGWSHNILTSYPFTFHICIALIALALLLFVKFLRGSGKGWYLASIAVFALPVMSYEMHLFYSALFPVISYFHDGDRLQALKRSLPYFAIVALLISVDLYFKLLGSREYSGTEISVSNVVDVARPLLFYSSSAMPGFMTLFYDFYIDYYEKNMPRSGALGYLSHVSWLWVVKAAIVGYVFFKLISRIRIDDPRRLHYSMVISLIFVFLPNLMIALTSKYQGWARKFDFHYISTHYSYYAMVFFIIAVAILLVNHGGGSKRAKVWLLTSVVLVLTFFTDVTNYHIYRTQYFSDYRFRCVDAVISSPAFQDIRDGERIHAPTLWKNDYAIMTSSETYWDRYIKAKTGKEVSVSDAPEPAGGNTLEFAIVPERMTYTCTFNGRGV